MNGKTIICVVLLIVTITGLRMHLETGESTTKYYA